MDSEDILRSLNRETGLVEGEDAARYVGTRIAKLAKIILGHPLIQMMVPSEALREMIGDVVLLESTLRPMTQLEAYIEMCVVNGLDPRKARMIGSTMGLSDTLPMTHPQSAKLDDETRKVLESMGVSPAEIDAAAREYEKAEAELDRIQGRNQESKSNEPPVELPPSLEQFLRQFESGDYKSEGD